MRMGSGTGSEGPERIGWGLAGGLVAALEADGGMPEW